LFSASELLAKAHLITSAAESSDIKSHGTIKSGLNRWGKLGNVKSAFVETFNKLSRIRESARYGGGDLSDLVEPEMLTIVRSELETLTPRLKRFSDDP
jgi:hypothetical protein